MLYNISPKIAQNIKKESCIIAALFLILPVQLYNIFPDLLLRIFCPAVPLSCLSDSFLSPTLQYTRYFFTNLTIFSCIFYIFSVFNNINVYIFFKKLISRISLIILIISS